MTTQPSGKFLEAIRSWVRDGNVEPLHTLMKVRQPNEDELKLLIGFMRRAKFANPVGHPKDEALEFAALLYKATVAARRELGWPVPRPGDRPRAVGRRESRLREDLIDDVLVELEHRWGYEPPDRETFENYLKRGKRQRRMLKN